jgi:hypothetical protein
VERTLCSFRSERRCVFYADVSSWHGDRENLCRPCYPRLKSGTREGNKGLPVGGDIEHQHY